MFDDYSYLAGPVIAFLFVVGIIALLIVAAIKDQKNWNKFASDHKCKLVAVQQGSYQSGYYYNSNGGYVYGSHYVDGTNTFKCDDGVTYTREQ